MDHLTYHLRSLAVIKQQSQVLKRVYRVEYVCSASLVAQTDLYQAYCHF